MSTNGHLTAQNGQPIYRIEPEGYVTTRDLCDLFGRHVETIRHCDIKGGKITPACGGTGSQAFRFHWADVITYWRTFHEGRCMRCGIMGEATPEQGFMCGPCAFEVRTGRVWWPDFRRGPASVAVRGRLSMALRDCDV